MEKKIITVIGSSGTIGQELVNVLSKQKGIAIRAVLRDVNGIREIPDVVWVKADVNEPSLLEATLKGTDRLFLLTGNHPGFGSGQIEVIKAAERLGVNHVVKLSALGASSKTKSGLAYEHWEAEKALEETSMSWTILRPHAFMQNWLKDEAKTAREEGVIYSAIGDGKVPFIDTRDISEVAAKILLNPQIHHGKRYVLTGGEAVGFEKLANAISIAIEKKVVYKSLSMEEMRSRMEKHGIPKKSIDSLLALAAYQRAGGATERVSGSVKEILGKEPRSVFEFAKDYQEYFLEDKLTT